MAKHLKTLCTQGGPPKIKYRTPLDARLAMVSMDLRQKKGRKRKGTASQDVPIREYFHDPKRGGCGYWHLTSEEKREQKAG